MIHELCYRCILFGHLGIEGAHSFSSFVDLTAQQFLIACKFANLGFQAFDAAIFFDQLLTKNHRLFVQGLHLSGLSVQHILLSVRLVGAGIEGSLAVGKVVLGRFKQQGLILYHRLGLRQFALDFCIFFFEGTDHSQYTLNFLR